MSALTPSGSNLKSRSWKHSSLAAKFYVFNLIFKLLINIATLFVTQCFVIVLHTTTLYIVYLGGWSGGAKVSCILCHRGVQLILAYSWARPAILVAGKGREVMFLFLLFLHFHSCSSFFPVPLFHLFCYLFCLFSPFLWETTQNDP